MVPLFVLCLITINPVKTNPEVGSFFEKHCTDHVANPTKSWITGKKSKVDPKIAQAFQRGHFCAASGANGMELAHIFPWAFIFKIMMDRLEQAYINESNVQPRNETNYEKVMELISDILLKQDHSATYAKPEREPNKQICRIEKINDKNVEVYYDSMMYYRDQGYLSYLTDELILKNVEWKTKALNHLNAIDYALEKRQSVDGSNNQQKINCAQIHEILKVLNSAPTNLRYGDARMNSGINSIDPMGGLDGQMTELEQKMFKVLKEHNAAPKVVELVPGSNEFYIPSSTGKVSHTTTVETTRYYIKCPIASVDCINIGENTIKQLDEMKLFNEY